MKFKEINNLSEDELITKEKQLKKDLFDMESHRQMGRVEKPASFRNLRRDIARILTVLNGRCFTLAVWYDENGFPVACITSRALIMRCGLFWST